MIHAKISERAVGAIFGPNGSKLRELEQRYDVSVDAKSLSVDCIYRLIRITGNPINICGILSEFQLLVDKSDIIISPLLPGMVYSYIQSALNPIRHINLSQSLLATRSTVSKIDVKRNYINPRPEIDVESPRVVPKIDVESNDVNPAPEIDVELPRAVVPKVDVEPNDVDLPPKIDVEPKIDSS